MRKTYLLIAIIWTAIIAFLCLTESSNIPKINFQYKDKVVHFVFYFLYVYFWFLVYKNIKYLFAIIVTAIVFGVVIEILQYYTTLTRSFDLLDILANTIGAVMCGWIIKKQIFIKLNK